MAAMPVIRPSATVNAMTDSGAPSSRQETTRGRPLRNTACPRGCAGGQLRAGGDLSGTKDDDGPIRGVDGQLHRRIEHAQQPLEVAVASRRQEDLDYISLVLVGDRRALVGLHLPAGAAGEHLGGIGGLAQDLADLGERHREQVVQHECQPLAWPE
jgi:hypothetical protein